jgi:hypothetical protein
MQKRQRWIYDIELFVAGRVDGSVDRFDNLIVTPLPSLQKLSEHDLKLLAAAVNSVDRSH